uniref:Uncharacterized protein n=1 Tax=Anopheles albimanus TaxID=7167 RepID=A0A182FXG6_ANOAL
MGPSAISVHRHFLGIPPS